MIDSILAWVSIYGAAVLAVAMVIGQVGIPVPTTLILLSLGALLIDGTVPLIQVFVFGLIGAVCGDQIAYAIGRTVGPPLKQRARGTKWFELLERAERYSDRWGAPGVFFSRWLVSPIGPYLNYVVGMANLPWPKFTAMSAAGEALWIAIFLALGAFFAQSITVVDSFVANAIWFAGTATLAVILGLQLRKAVLKRRASRAAKTDTL